MQQHRKMLPNRSTQPTDRVTPISRNINVDFDASSTVRQRLAERGNALGGSWTLVYYSSLPHRPVIPDDAADDRARTRAHYCRHTTRADLRGVGSFDAGEHPLRAAGVVHVGTKTIEAVTRWTLFQ